MPDRPIDKVVDVIGIVGILLCLYLLAMKWFECKTEKSPVETEQYLRGWTDGG